MPNDFDLGTGTADLSSGDGQRPSFISPLQRLAESSSMLRDVSRGFRGLTRRPDLDAVDNALAVRRDETARLLNSMTPSLTAPSSTRSAGIPSMGFPQMPGPPAPEPPTAPAPEPAAPQPTGRLPLGFQLSGLDHPPARSPLPSVEMVNRDGAGFDRVTHVGMSNPAYGPAYRVGQGGAPYEFPDTSYQYAPMPQAPIQQPIPPVAMQRPSMWTGVGIGVDPESEAPSGGISPVSTPGPYFQDNFNPAESLRPTPAPYDTSQSGFIQDVRRARTPVVDPGWAEAPPMTPEEWARGAAQAPIEPWSIAGLRRFAEQNGASPSFASPVNGGPSAPVFRLPAQAPVARPTAMPRPSESGAGVGTPPVPAPAPQAPMAPSSSSGYPMTPSLAMALASRQGGRQAPSAPQAPATPESQFGFQYGSSVAGELMDEDVTLLPPDRYARADGAGPTMASYRRPTDPRFDIGSIETTGSRTRDYTADDEMDARIYELNKQLGWANQAGDSRSAAAITEAMQQIQAPRMQRQKQEGERQAMQSEQAFTREQNDANRANQIAVAREQQGGQGGVTLPHTQREREIAQQDIAQLSDELASGVFNKTLDADGAAAIAEQIQGIRKRYGLLQSKANQMLGLDGLLDGGVPGAAPAGDMAAMRQAYIELSKKAKAGKASAKDQQEIRRLWAAMGGK